MADPVELPKGPEPKVTLGPLGQENKTPIKIAAPDDDFVPLDDNLGKPSGKKPLSMLPQGPSQGGVDDSAVGQVMNMLRPYISGAAGLGGGMLAGGPVGSFLGGVAGYTGADVAQKELNPTNSESLGEALSDSATEGLINEVGGRIFQGIGAGVKAVRNANQPEIYKLFPKSSAALENFGYYNLAAGARILEDFGAPKASIEALDKSGGAGFTRALMLSNLMNSGGRFTKNVFQDPKVLFKKITDTLEKGINKNATPGQFQSPVHYASQEALDLMNGTATPFQTLDDVIADKTKLQKVLAVGQSVGPKNLNVRKDLQAYYWNRVFDEATTHTGPGQATIDPKKINDLWMNPKLTENLETLYGKQGKENLDTFMKQVYDTQKAPMTFPGLGKLKYIGGGFAAGGMLGGLLNASAMGAAGKALGALYIPTAVMGKLLTNTNVGRFITAARGAEPLSQGGKLLSRGIFNALEGSRVALLDDKNQKFWGTVARQPDGSVSLLPER